MPMRPLVLMLAATALAAPVANAQFAPPPMEQTEPLTMPPPTIIKPAQVENPRIKEAAQQRKEQKEKIAQLRSPAALPDLPFESLVQLDADGRLIRLEGVPFEIALDRHPMIDKHQRPRLERAIADRHHRIEREILDNLDKIQVIESGGIDRLSAFDMQSMSSLRILIRDMVGPEDALAEYQRVGALTPVQVRFLRQRMLAPYNKALNEDLGSYQMFDAEGNPVSQYDAMVRMAMHDRAAEYMGIYYNLLVDAASRGSRIAAALYATPDESNHELADLMAETIVELADADRAQQLAAMRSLMARLTVDQRRALLQATLDTRS